MSTRIVKKRKVEKCEEKEVLEVKKEEVKQEKRQEQKVVLEELEDVEETEEQLEDVEEKEEELEEEEEEEEEEIPIVDPWMTRAELARAHAKIAASVSTAASSLSFLLAGLAQSDDSSTIDIGKQTRRYRNIVSRADGEKRKVNNIGVNINDHCKAEAVKAGVPVTKMGANCTMTECRCLHKK